MKINIDQLTNLCVEMAKPNPNLSAIEAQLNETGLSVYENKETKTFKSLYDILNDISANLDQSCFDAIKPQRGLRAKMGLYEDAAMYE